MMTFNPIFLLDIPANNGASRSRSVPKTTYLFSDIIKLNMNSSDEVANMDADTDAASGNKLLDAKGSNTLSLIKLMFPDSVRGEKNIGLSKETGSKTESKDKTEKATIPGTMNTNLPLLVDFNQLLFLLNQIKTNKVKEEVSATNNILIKKFSIVVNADQLSQLINDINNVGGIDELKINHPNKGKNENAANGNASIDDTILNLLNQQGSNIEILSNGIKFVIKQSEANSIQSETAKSILNDFNNELSKVEFRNTAANAENFTNAADSENEKVNEQLLKITRESKTAPELSNASIFKKDGSNKLFVVEINPSASEPDLDLQFKIAESPFDNSVKTNDGKSLLNNSGTKNVDDFSVDVSNKLAGGRIIFIQPEENDNNTPAIFNIRNYQPDKVRSQTAPAQTETTDSSAFELLKNMQQSQSKNFADTNWNEPLRGINFEQTTAASINVNQNDGETKNGMKPDLQSSGKIIDLHNKLNSAEIDSQADKHPAESPENSSHHNTAETGADKNNGVKTKIIEVNSAASKTYNDNQPKSANFNFVLDDNKPVNTSNNYSADKAEDVVNASFELLKNMQQSQSKNFADTNWNEPLRGINFEQTTAASINVNQNDGETKNGMKPDLQSSGKIIDLHNKLNSAEIDSQADKHPAESPENSSHHNTAETGADKNNGVKTKIIEVNSAASKTYNDNQPKSANFNFVLDDNKPVNTSNNYSADKAEDVVNASKKEDMTQADKNVNGKDNSVSSGSIKELTDTSKFTDTSKSELTTPRENNNGFAGSEKAAYIVDKLNNTLIMKPGISDTNLKPAVHINNLINELSNSIKNSDKKEIVIKLEPENLGKINVSIEVDKNAVSAKIHVENDLVKQILKNNVDVLQNALLESGLSVKNYSVTTDSGQKKPAQTNKKKKAAVENITPAGMKNVKIEIVKNMGYNTYDFII